MSEKLIIKNFGAIREAELDLKRTTVFIGAQGSGKSTLAKLIAIFRTPTLEASNFYDFCKEFNIQNFIAKESYLKYSAGEHEITYENGSLSLSRNLYSMLKSQEREYEELENRLYAILKELKELEASKNKYGKEDIVKRIKHHQKILELVKKYEQECEVLKGTFENVRYNIEKISYHSKTAIYIPAERFLISAIADSLMGFIDSNIALPGSIKGFGSLFEMARKEISFMKIPSLNVEYKFEGSQNRVYIDNEKSINLSESASGFQTLIPLKIVVEYLSNRTKVHKTFIVEEPELNLYPITQKHLVAYLVEKCTKGNNELVITTHSPYVLSSLNNLLFAYQVAQKNPEQADKVKAIIPEAHWLNPDEFVAYNVEDGTVRKIFNDKTGVIGENELDGISEDISGERDELFEIYKSDSKIK